MPLQIQDAYVNTVNICKTWSAPADGDILEVYTPSALPAAYASSMSPYAGFVVDLKLMAAVASLTENQIPQINLEDSESERFAKLREFEWNSEAYYIELLMKTDDNSPWVFVGRVSLKKITPYVVIPLLPLLSSGNTFPVASGTRLALRCVDGGYGTPTIADKITVIGAVREEALIADLTPVAVVGGGGSANTCSDTLPQGARIIQEVFEFYGDEIEYRALAPDSRRIGMKIFVPDSLNFPNIVFASSYADIYQYASSFQLQGTYEKLSQLGMWVEGGITPSPVIVTIWRRDV